MKETGGGGGGGGGGARTACPGCGAEFAGEESAVAHYARMHAPPHARDDRELLRALFRSAAESAPPPEAPRGRRARLAVESDEDAAAGVPGEGGAREENGDEEVEDGNGSDDDDDDDDDDDYVVESELPPPRSRRAAVRRPVADLFIAGDSSDGELLPAGTGGGRAVAPQPPAKRRAVSPRAAPTKRSPKGAGAAYDFADYDDLSDSDFIRSPVPRPKARATPQRKVVPSPAHRGRRSKVSVLNGPLDGFVVGARAAATPVVNLWPLVLGPQCLDEAPGALLARRESPGAGGGPPELPPPAGHGTLHQCRQAIRAAMLAAMSPDATFAALVAAFKLLQPPPPPPQAAVAAAAAAVARPRPGPFLALLDLGDEAPAVTLSPPSSPLCAASPSPAPAAPGTLVLDDDDDDLTQTW